MSKSIGNDGAFRFPSIIARSLDMVFDIRKSNSARELRIKMAFIFASNFDLFLEQFNNSLRANTHFAQATKVHYI